MLVDFSQLPIEIYCDLLEEQGEDISKLRAFIELDGFCHCCYFDGEIDPSTSKYEMWTGGDSWSDGDTYSYTDYYQNCCGDGEESMALEETRNVFAEGNGDGMYMGGYGYHEDFDINGDII